MTAKTSRRIFQTYCQEIDWFSGKHWARSLNSKIQKFEVVHYPRGPGNPKTESFDLPDWHTVFGQLELMDPYEIPILTLSKHADIHGCDLMMVCGGHDAFHIQIADTDGKWFQAFDPEGTDELIEVWTSDQGFSCERKYTWPLTTASQIIKHYFNTGERHLGYQWE